jgi:hypothetical protein
MHTNTYDASIKRKKKMTRTKTRGFPIQDTTFKFCPTGLETCLNTKKQQRQKGFDKILSPKCRYQGFRGGQLNKEKIQNPRLGGSSRRGWKRKLYLNASEDESSGCLFVCSISLSLSLSLSLSQTHRFRQFSAGFLIRFFSFSLTFNFSTIFLFYDFYM